MATLTLAGSNKDQEQRDAQPSSGGIWENDIIQFIVLLGITFVSVYYTPRYVNEVIFLVFLPLIYRSKKDYLWMAWFFVIIDAPGRLFSCEGANDPRIPLYTLGAGASLLFQELFILVYLAKFYFDKEKLQFVFKKPFLYFYLVMLVFLIFSLLLGMNVKSMILTFRALLPWALVFIVPFFINDPDKVYRAGRLIFPFAFLALAAQVYTFITGSYLDNAIRGVRFVYDFHVKEGGDVSRAWSANFISLFALILSMFYLLSKKKLFNSNYLAAVGFCATLQVFLSATRGYTLAYGFLMAASMLQMAQSSKVFKLFNLAIAAMVVFYILQLVFPPIGYQVSAASKRISTIFLLAEGDISAGGTLSRIDVRGKRVLDKFEESPILGWGFSTTYFEYEDGHVGPQTMLLNVGVVGAIYLNVLYLYLCLVTWLYSRKKKPRQEWGKAPIVFLFGLIAIFFIHGSSTQFWGYSIEFEQEEKVMTLAFLFAAFHALIVHTGTEPVPSVSKRPI
ncbi:MAG: O-antigen ligase family protein [Lewinellaceae bacterium]|nr:O-antigen ligase family protein [Lewinellaceae bacterium]